MIKKGDTIVNVRTGQRMTFLKTWLETNGTQLQLKCESPTSSTKEPVHIHPYQENKFQIISGELTFWIDGETRKAKKGDLVTIPKNTAHEFWNDGTENAIYLQEFFPALKIDQLFETFFALARNGKFDHKGKPTLLQASVSMLHFQNEVRLAKPSWPLQKLVFRMLAPIGKLLGYIPTHEISTNA